MRVILGGFASVMLAGCGWYTNIPAQINVVSVEPSTVTVRYAKAKDTTGTVTNTVSFDQPVITLSGQPGSIGALFTVADITYRDSLSLGTDKAPATVTDLKVQKVYSSQRVDSSAMRENAGGGFVDIKPDEKNPGQMGNTKLTLGTTKFTLPIITNEVVAYGAPGSGKSASIFAQIILSGTDDANWPLKREIIVPISFVNTTP